MVKLNVKNAEPIYIISSQPQSEDPLIYKS